MNRKSAKSIISVMEVYGMYLITGIACTCIGSAMMLLTGHFGVSIPQVAALASAFAVGRVIMVFFCGMITEKFGARTAFGIGFLALTTNLLLMPVNTNYWVAMVLMAIAGVGMGFQDSACPVVLSTEFPLRYSGAMSAGQAFFGAGCFLPPLAISILLSLNLSWKLMYFVFGILALILFIGVFFMSNNYHMAVKEKEEKKAVQISGVKGTWKLIIWLFVGMFFYSAILNVVHTYTNAYVMHYGVAETVAVNVLTMFSIGAMLGSLLFIPILRKVSSHTVLLFNSIATLLLLGTAILFPSITVFFITFTLAGVFSGVLFSVLVTIATEEAGPHKAMIASMMGLVGGVSDILTPLLTGKIVVATSVVGAFAYNGGAMILTVVSAIVLFVLHKNKKANPLL